MKKKISLAISLILLANIAVNATKNDTATGNKNVKLYITAKDDNLRLSKVADLKFIDKTHSKQSDRCVFINENKQFQTFVGIGGALTDASAETFYKMPLSKQQQFIKAYYNSAEGIGYTLGRTNIHSCDFSSESYTYVENDDIDLKTFNVNHDLKYRIPFIKRALAEAGDNFILFASPWSPPAWMKDNDNMLHGGKLLSKYNQSWANYFVKFIKEYKKNGIPIWGVTVQNEPMASQTWESCIYTAEEERDFVKNYLGPTFQKSGLANKKIIVWDHNRDLAFHRADEILKDKEAAKYIWGTGFHWYEDWSDRTSQQFENIKLINEAYPSKNLLFTEGCIANFNLNEINNWSHGERYGEAMINDFNNGAVGWTDWNLLLDEQGGPNHVGNFCFAPVHYNTKTDELIYSNEYYYIGQFSKFIRPGAKRISASSNKSDIITTAFKNIDGKIAVVVMNKSDNEKKLSLWLNDYSVESKVPGNSISTFVIE